MLIDLSARTVKTSAVSKVLPKVNFRKEHQAQILATIEEKKRKLERLHNSISNSMERKDDYI